MILSHITFRNESNYTSGFNTFRTVCFGLKRVYDKDKWVQVDGRTEIFTNDLRNTPASSCFPRSKQRRHIEIICFGETYELPLKPKFTKHIQSVKYTVPVGREHVLRVSYCKAPSEDYYRVRVCFRKARVSVVQPAVHRVSSCNDVSVRSGGSNTATEAASAASVAEREKSITSVYFPITQEQTEQYMTRSERQSRSSTGSVLTVRESRALKDGDNKGRATSM